jgi:cation:H+ antiporter
MSKNACARASKPIICGKITIKNAGNMKFTPIKPPDNPEDDAQGRYKPLRPLHHHDHSHDHTHDHGTCCGHDHHHDEPPPTGLRGLFHRASAYRPQIILGSTAALLATTALTAPLLATTIGAGLAMAAALYLLPKACDVAIDSASSLGKKLKLSGVGIGLGLAMMESFPEFAVAANSIITGARDVGLGNIIGSNIAHVLLILGTVAAIAGVKKSQGTAWKFNVAALAGASTAFGTQLATGRLIPAMGAGMMALAAAYLYTNYRMQKRDAERLGLPADDHGHHHHHHGGNHVHVERSPVVNGLLAAGGMGAVIYTAHTAVEHASTLAQNLGAPPILLGSLALALGTAAPEFAINVKAALKGKTDMAVGNIIGCSVLNLLAVGGLLAATGTPVPETLQPSTPLGVLNLAAWGTGVGLASTTLLANKGELKRWHGFAALALYAAFVTGSATLGAAQKSAPHIPENAKPAIITPV